MNPNFLAGPIPLPPLPLLGTTGTELLQFALLLAVGTWFCRRQGKDAGRFVGAALFAVSFFYLLCPETSPFQKLAGDALMSAMAVLQAGLMNLAGTAVQADGISVVGATRFTLARGCMGLSYLAMAWLCVMAYPMAWKRQLGAVFALTLGMLWLNALRLIVLYHLWAGGSYDAFSFFHRIGGGLFALGAAGLFWGVLAAKPGPVTAPAKGALVPAPAKC